MPQQFHEFKRLLPYAKGILFAQIVIFRRLKRVHSETESVPSLFYFMFNLTVKTSSRPYYYYYIERQKKHFSSSQIKEISC